MSSHKKYILNPETLIYEIQKVSGLTRFSKWASVIVAGAGLGYLYFWLFTSVLGLELPKTMLLKMKNAEWVSKIEVLDSRLNSYDEALAGLQIRDDNIYRSIFGMNAIPSEVRNAGFGGVDRYAYLDIMSDNSLLKKTTIRMDVLMKKTYIQSKSFDEVSLLAQKAGDMATSVPAIPPLSPDPRDYRLSSGFGYRTDPINGRSKMHTGMDFSCHQGTPVYSTGDGVVEDVSYEFFGYGNSIMIDHGFGYKTRYAHLKSIGVSRGMKITRGELIGTTGNSGRSTGPHLHYEVIYKGNYVNPNNYLDMSMPVKEYAALTKDNSNKPEVPIDKPSSRHLRR